MIYGFAFSSQMQEHMISSDDDDGFIACRIGDVFGDSSCQIFADEGMGFTDMVFVEEMKYLFGFVGIMRDDEVRSSLIFDVLDDTFVVELGTDTGSEDSVFCR